MAVRRLGCGPTQFLDPFCTQVQIDETENASQKIYDRTVKPNVEYQQD